MTELPFLPAAPDPTRPEREPRKHQRHDWVEIRYVTMPDQNFFGCRSCGAIRDETRSRRGRQSRNYGNRAELDIARKHGGRKVGHAGGPADVLGATRKLQVKSTRRRPPAMWRDAFAGLDSIADSRLAVLLLRFVRAGNLGPEDFYVVRAADFLAWYGIDGEET